MTATPKVVFDLDEVIREAKPAPPFTFLFDGRVYTLPGRPDMRAAASFEAGKLDEGFRNLLGVVQWEQMKVADAVFDDDAFIALHAAYERHLGADLGESEASATSSPKTVKR